MGENCAEHREAVTMGTMGMSVIVPELFSLARTLVQQHETFVAECPVGFIESLGHHINYFDRVHDVAEHLGRQIYHDYCCPCPVF